MALRGGGGRHIANIHVHDDPKNPQGAAAGFGLGRDRARAQEAEGGEGGEGKGI